MGVKVKQLPNRDDGGIPVEQRTRAMSEIGPTTYHQGQTVFPVDPNQPPAEPEPAAEDVGDETADAETDEKKAAAPKKK
jgi:hypothetical protein